MNASNSDEAANVEVPNEKGESLPDEGLAKPPLPKSWPGFATVAFLQAFALANRLMRDAIGGLTEALEAQLLLDAIRLRKEVELLQLELAIKDRRFAKLPARKRPHYDPVDRLNIMLIRAERGLNAAQTARRFFVAASTVGEWFQKALEGEDKLVRKPEPVNRFPDFVAAIVDKIARACPQLGRRQLAAHLANASLLISASTLRRMLLRKKQPPTDPPRKAPGAEEALPKKKAERVVTAKRPNHVWHADLTMLPVSNGFWVPWIPYAEQPRYPHCHWLVVVVDHFSRKALAIRHFASQPTQQQVLAVFNETIAAYGKPKYLITDQGVQFRDAYRVWCRQTGIQPRFGAVGQHGSIAVVERFIKTLKHVLLPSSVFLPLSAQPLIALLESARAYYNCKRPHSALNGATPDDVYLGVAPRHAKPAFETRIRMPARRCRGEPGVRLEADVVFFQNHHHLPTVQLRQAA